MGAGSTKAGRGGAGFDPPTITVPVVSVPPIALRYEGELRDWALADTGQYRSVTSTEQGMILSICVTQGQIKSNVTLGNTLSDIQYLGSPNLQADCEDRVRNSNPAKALVAAGKAKIVRVIVQTAKGRLQVEMQFKALDAPNSQVLSGKWSN